MQLTGTLLVVDDDVAVGKVLSALAHQAGMEVHWVQSGEAALVELERRPVDVVLTDLRMPGLDGIGVLKAVGERWPDVPVVMISAHGTVATAVEAMRLGAANFVEKPIDRDELIFVLGKALASAQPERPPVGPQLHSFADFVGTSAPMREVYERIQKAARGNATVLLLGETGTGKELAARALHQASSRRDKPFAPIHCGALPEGLLESELFGHEKGAFTGAVSRKPGRIEVAHGGTVFLDEIGDVSAAIQLKLLRVLQDRTFERVGGGETLKVDVRFIAATHRDLEALVAKEAFREDLFYRLNVLPIWLPPLRDRTSDIPELVHHFVEVHGSANGRPGAVLAEDALDLLVAQPWPGNVRQLENFLERVVVLSDDERITAADVQRELHRSATSPRGDPSGGNAPPAGAGVSTLEVQRRQLDKEALRDALQRTRGNRTKAAKLLGVSRRTLYNMLDEYGLSEPQPQ
jgi:two-component system response regulator AtoC